jgi:hypothetical protein
MSFFLCSLHSAHRSPFVSNSIVVRMPPVPGAVDSFRTSSPVRIDEEDGGIDIQDLGLASSIMIKQDKPLFPGQNPQSAHTRNSFPIEDFYTHGHIPARFPKQYLRDKQDPNGIHEHPTSPSHLFLRYHYPQPQQPPLPKHYKCLDRNRTGDLDQSIPISPPLRAQFFSQATAPVQMTEEDQLSATEETSSKVQDLI